jgi:hypothetical protein
MTKLYLSSTFQDLHAHREAVYKAVRRLGHKVELTDGFVASDRPVLETALEEVGASDVFVLLVAWRYGYVPPSQTHSITELELNAARARHIPCLVFIVPESAAWPLAYVDQDPTEIRRFRRRLEEEFLVSYFTSPDDLALRIAAGLQEWTAEGAATPPLIPSVAVPQASPPAADVFLSYAHEDSQPAQAIAERLAEERWSVFWDRTIPVGLVWDDMIETALDNAKCVVVLWTQSARDSEWVRSEADEGAKRGVLAPALLEEIKIPLRFRRIQAANLIGWTPELHDAPGILALVAGVRRCLTNTSAA